MGCPEPARPASDPPLDAATNRPRIRESVQALHRLRLGQRVQAFLRAAYRLDDVGLCTVDEPRNHMVWTVPGADFVQPLQHLQVLAIGAGGHIAVPKCVSRWAVL